MNHRTRFSVANCTSSGPRQGPLRRIASASNRRITDSIRALSYEPLGAADGEVLHPATATMHQPIGPYLLALAGGLLQHVEREVSVK